jgi:hypothetical protein
VEPSDGDALLGNDFESSATGQYVSGWFDTGAGNSMMQDDSLFRVVDLSGNRVFGTTSTLTNIHSHYVGTGSSDWSAYEFRGRMLITDPDAGIGVTVHSQYPRTDTYYRIRREPSSNTSQRDFHMAPHPDGTPIHCESRRTGIVPKVNQWYRFRFQVVPAQSSTSIRAKVWQAGTAEPATWQVRCEDRLADRPGAGTVGVWSMTAGRKYWDDLAVVSLSGSGLPPSQPSDPLGRPGKPQLVLP